MNASARARLSYVWHCHEILYLYIRNSAPQDRGEHRPLRDGPIGQERRRGKAHIVGYYALEQRMKLGAFLGVWGGAKRRAAVETLVSLVGSARARELRASGRGKAKGRSQVDQEEAPTL